MPTSLKSDKFKWPEAQKVGGIPRHIIEWQEADDYGLERLVSEFRGNPITDRNDLEAFLLTLFDLAKQRYYQDGPRIVDHIDEYDAEYAEGVELDLIFTDGAKDLVMDLIGLNDPDGLLATYKKGNLVDQLLMMENPPYAAEDGSYQYGIKVLGNQLYIGMEAESSWSATKGAERL